MFADLTSDQMIGVVGGLVGGVLGIAGGAVGTYFSIKSARGPEQRRLTIVASVTCWLLVTCHLAALFLLPEPWKPVTWVVYSIFFATGLVYFNKAVAKTETMRQNGSETDA